MPRSSPHKSSNKPIANQQLTNETPRPKSPKKVSKRSLPVRRRGVLKAVSKTSLIKKKSHQKSQKNKEIESLDCILCIDESIIESSPKSILEGFLRDLRLPFRGLTKSKLQSSLRKYLKQRIQQCPLPATLLKKAKFWRVTVVRKSMCFQGKAPRTGAKFIVRTEWGHLGRKRSGERQTPRKIIPTPTKNQIWESKEYSTKEQAEKVARNKIRQKLNTGYYLSTEGSLPWCESRENSTPALVRPDNHRTLKFAGVLKMREFEQDLSAMTYTPVPVAPKVNFLSDNEM